MIWFLLRRSGQVGCHLFSQERQQVRLEPRIPLQPGVVAPGWMRQRHDDRIGRRGDLAARRRRSRSAIFAPMARDARPAHRRRRRAPAVTSGSRAMSRVTPRRRAFPARRQVGAARIQSRKAEAHRHDRDPACVIEGRRIDAHPVAEAIAGRIGEGPAGGVDAGPRRLAGDADGRGRRYLEDRSRFVRQRLADRPVAADPAGADIARKAVQRLSRLAPIHLPVFARLPCATGFPFCSR